MPRWSPWTPSRHWSRSSTHLRPAERRALMARGGTPAMVALDAAGVTYRVHEFDAEPSKHGFGQAAAVALGVQLERVFKTLIATVDDHRHVVAIVPVSGQLSLKELAAAVHGKRAEMCPPDAAE